MTSPEPEQGILHMALPDITMTMFTSTVAALTMLTLVVGYGRALLSRQGAVFHLVSSICMIYIAYVARTTYWDMLFIRDAGWPTREDINPWFDVLAIWGGIHGHIAIYLMIPKEDRDKWTIFTAWLYPPFMVASPFRRMLRWLFSRG
jgi:hypothetical protein